jgi:hypothetical protein
VILVDLRGPGLEGQGLGFNVCVAPRDVHSAQLTRRDKSPSRNGEERREDLEWRRTQEAGENMHMVLFNIQTDYLRQGM